VPQKKSRLFQHTPVKLSQLRPGESEMSAEKLLTDATLDTLKNFNVLPGEARVKATVVCALFMWSTSTLFRRVHAGKFPAPIRDTITSRHWRVSDIRKHLKEGVRA